MDFNEDEIRAITESVWDAILGLTVLPCAEPTGSPANPMIGSVGITGAWRGTVVMQCPPALVHHVAGIMFGLAPDTATLAHAQDAMGEITNMIGGNLKALLPEPCQLSFPQVLAGTEHTAAPAGQRIARVAFACESDVFLVSIHEEEAPTLEAAPQ